MSAARTRRGETGGMGVEGEERWDGGRLRGPPATDEGDPPEADCGPPESDRVQVRPVVRLWGINCLRHEG